VIPQYAPEFGEEEREAVNTYMASGGWLTEHTETELFEEEFAKAVGARWASAVNNGTISLSIALKAMGLGPGDRVIVPDLTMIATATSAMLIGCKPVLCDIDPDNLCLDLDKALKLQIDTGAKAVIYVPFNGRSHSADRLISFRGALRCQNAYLLEDAAQALGSKTPDGVPIGTLGEISSFSLSPHKIVSTGQGGMLLTSDPHMRKRIEEIKDFGRESGGADIHPTFGINAKFTDLQAVIGRAQLKKLRWRMQRKREMYETYIRCLDGMGMAPGHSSIPWFIDFYG
jgi:perosamine synthetase